MTSIGRVVIGTEFFFNLLDQLGKEKLRIAREALSDFLHHFT
jgi:hypothetical protein